MNAPLRVARHAARADAAPPAPVTALRYVPVSAITRRVQVRGSDPPPEAVAAAAQEFLAVGLSQPVRLVTTDGLTYLLVSGNKRLLAAQSLGWTTIPALVDVVPAITDDVITAAMRRQYSEHHTSRPMTVWQTACYIRWLAEDRKLTHRAITAETRMSSATVHRYKRLLRGCPYPPALLEYLDSEDATVRSAERLIRDSANSAEGGAEPAAVTASPDRASAPPGSPSERAAATYVRAAEGLVRYPVAGLPVDELRAAARRVLAHLESA